MMPHKTHQNGQNLKSNALSAFFYKSRSYLRGCSEDLFKKGVTLPSSENLTLEIQKEVAKIILDQTT